MHNISISFILVLLSLLGCQSSKTSKTNNPTTHTDNKGSIKRTPLYKPFTEFNGDTLQYLNYNFVDRKDQYIGKPFSVLYRDLEITVKSCIPTTDANNGFASSAIILCFYDTDTERYLMNSDGIPSYSVNVGWEKPLSAEVLFQLYKASHGNWTPSFEAFVANDIIKDVAVLKYVNPQSKKQ